MERSAESTRAPFHVAQWTGMRSRNARVFRPHPLLLISSRLRNLLGELEAKGIELEVAHLVG